ncbi:MAG: substrate-binding domain-containing protein, partial [Pseudomonadota bacterium]
MKLSGFNHLLLFFALIHTCAGEIRIAVSDLLAGYVTPPLKAYAQSENVDLDIESIGSLPALDRLRSDEIDLAVIAVPENQEVPRDEFNIYPFAYDVAVVAVNDSNPLDEITMSRLGGIFGGNEEFNFNTWGDLGLSGWGSRNIKPLVGTEQDSIALELFRYAVFSGSSLKSSVAMVLPREVEDLLAADSASIAILSRLPDSDDVKVLMISSEENAPAFGPTKENIHYGDYPIRLSFYIAFDPRDQSKLKGITRALLGDEIAENLSQNGLFSLPDTVRRRLLI